MHIHNKSMYLKLLRSESHKQIGGGRKIIYFVRHGETQYNVEKRSQGYEVDIPLNLSGIEQSKITGTYFDEYISNEHKIDIIFTSPLKRAMHTANIISDKISYKPDIVILNDLRENMVGKISGTTKAERDNNENFDEFNTLNKKIVENLIPTKIKNIYDDVDKEIVRLGGESVKQNKKRCKQLINFILDQPHKTIICVTHSGTIDAILMYLTNQINPCSGDLSNGSNCSISCVEFENNKKWTIITAPNTKHFGILAKK